jgi:hypothetical protein
MGVRGAMSRGPAQYTSTMTVNNVGDPEPVIAHIECRSITVKEDPSVSGWPTVDYKVTGAVAGSTPIQCPAGTEYTFEATYMQCFAPGEIVGYVETVSGSTTFQQRENRK